MPSPFPGMDPYIESWIWGDFHSRLIAAIYDRLSPRLPSRYIASTELFIWRVDDLTQERLMLGGPEIYIAKRSRSRGGAAVATVAAPFNTILSGVVRKQKHIKVIDKIGRRVVTVIECLSPSNKSAGDDGQAYRMKRDEYIGSGINLVEIDLLRGGIRLPLGDPAPPISDYYILVNRASEPAHLAIWPFSVRDPMPPAQIPLDADVADIVIDLRACLDHVYDLGRYNEQLSYSKPTSPAMRKPDVAWARKLLANRLNPSPRKPQP